MLRIKHKVFVTRGSIAQGYASSCPGTPIGEPPPKGVLEQPGGLIVTQTLRVQSHKRSCGYSLLGKMPLFQRGEIGSIPFSRLLPALVPPRGGSLQMLRVTACLE
jgi:hypothetical protein